ncbi:MAG: lamin tail domain-containing protein [Planctomycetes bacterium]|nr:lamin tail domain-containing protein [Planctomycetota bacterium]
MFPRMLAATLVGALLSSFAFAQVTINEFVYDMGGSDNDEYIELYNAGATPVDLSNWVIDAEDAAFPNSNNTDITIPGGSSIPAGGYFLIANQLTTSPVLLAADLLFSGSIENSANSDSLILRDSGGAVMDAVAYETAAMDFVPNPEQIEGAGIRGEQRAFGYAQGSLVFQAFSRITDGYDTNNNGYDFRMALPTPGATNNPTFDIIQSSYLLDAEVLIHGLAAGDQMPNWYGSCEHPSVVDYATAGIPASPFDAVGAPTDPNTDLIAQLGCVATGDSIGGSFWVETLPNSSYTLECFVYFETAPTDFGAAEYWHLGFHGTAAYFFNLPSPIWTGAFSDLSDITGAGLSYVVDDTSATISLVDYGDGSIVNVLGSMPAPSGWTRVRMQATQNFIELRIGGTYGAQDGTLLSGALTGEGGFGGVYGGYRKVGNTGTGIGRGVSPLYIDSLVVSSPSFASDCHGQATDGTAGTPRLELTGLPILGNAAFGFATSGLLPSTSYFQLIGINTPGTGLDISAALPGAVPPGLTLWVPRNIFAGLSPSTNASGEGGTAVPLPSNPSLLGGQLWAQAMQQDVGLGFPLPISATKGLRFQLGNF